MAGLPSEVPDAADFGLLRAFLATRGFPQAWINSVIGASPADRTRAEITQLLKDAMRVLPKA